MRNKIQKKQPGFEFNWKNKLAIWLVIVFIAMAIGQRSKISEKRYQDNVDEVLLEKNELEIPDLRRKKQG
ncbi:MAG: hypothetical protein KDK45_26320 [Leptospiraceae bacterium]|nr:hypothetical protein [Leptospiraceae bacterium]